MVLRNPWQSYQWYQQSLLQILIIFALIMAVAYFHFSGFNINFRWTTGLQYPPFSCFSPRFKKRVHRNVVIRQQKNNSVSKKESPSCCFSRRYVSFYYPIVFKRFRFISTIVPSSIRETKIRPVKTVSLASRKIKTVCWQQQNSSTARQPLHQQQLISHVSYPLCISNPCVTNQLAALPT